MQTNHILVPSSTRRRPGVRMQDVRASPPAALPTAAPPPAALPPAALPPSAPVSFTIDRTRAWPSCEHLLLVNQDGHCVSQNKISYWGSTLHQQKLSGGQTY